MFTFQRLSIRDKLRLMMMLACIAALVLSTTVIVGFGIIRQKQAAEQRLKEVWESIWDSVWLNVDIGDREACEKVLNSMLTKKPGIVVGALYLKDRQLFASYVRTKSEAAPPAKLTVVGLSISSLSSLDYSDLGQNAEMEGIGFLYLRSDLTEELRVLRLFLAVVCGSFLLASVVAWWLSNRFQRVFVGPILQLLQTAKTVSHRKQYDLRAERVAEDELGQLVDGFNEMLEQIDIRDKELQKHQDELEGQILKRTKQLTQLNEELTLSKERADQASEAKSLFLASMSHEIRTPLNAVLGYAQILQRDSSLGKDQRKAVSTIERSGSHLLALINDILDLSKIESGRMELSEAEFDLKELISGLSVMFELRCQQKGLAWKTEGMDGSPILVRGDEGKLRQVLINLLGNAVKFTRSGSVRLRLHRTEGDIFEFVIEDTGPGIPKEVQSKIFEPFTQEKVGREKGGTGLGLAIARRHSELMGGELRMEPKEGKGSRFCFSVPLHEATGTILIRPSVRTGQVARLKAGTLVKALVADDIKENREILQRFLEDLGVTVMTADDGESALETLSVEHFDIAFLDIRMPGISGIEVAERVLEKSGAEPTKLVAVSASTLLHEQRAYAEKGFDAFVPKPFRLEQIFECLAQYLGVAFEYESEGDEESKQQLPKTGTKLELPEELLERLKRSAEVYSVTEFEEHLAEVEVLGENEQRLAERLRELSRDVQIDEILRILGSARSRAG